MRVGTNPAADRAVIAGGGAASGNGGGGGAKILSRSLPALLK
jgi:hypothetical protein